MAMEFGWWAKDPETGKFQICVEIHGGNIVWRRKQGHHTSWEPFSPGDEEWQRLLAEAERRVPRRLLSPKQFAEIQRSCEMRDGRSSRTQERQRREAPPKIVSP